MNIKRILYLKKGPVLHIKRFLNKKKKKNPEHQKDPRNLISKFNIFFPRF